MSIRKEERRDGCVYVVDEYTGFTLDGKRDRKRVTCSTYAEAKREQAKLVALRDATRNRSGRITLEQYVERWYLPTLADLAATTRDTYRRELRLRILPALGERDVRDINRADIQRMVSACATEAVARKSLGLLKTILNEAVTDRLITLNPANGRYAMPAKGRKRDNGLVLGTFAEIRDVMAALEKFRKCADYMQRTRDNAVKLAVTGFYMGLRPEERYALEWEDFDFSAGTCRIDKALTAASAEEGGNVLKETKTENSTRLVPVPAAAAAILRPMHRSGNVIQTGNFVQDARGGKLTPSSARHTWLAFQRYAEKADGIDCPGAQVTLENMRHSFATSFLHAGGNVEDLSRILGHADINTTFRRYVKPDVSALQAAVSRIAM